MTDRITAIEVPKEVLTLVANKLCTSRYCHIANILPLNDTHFLVLVANDNYDIRDAIMPYYKNINAAFSNQERNKYLYRPISEVE